VSGGADNAVVTSLGKILFLDCEPEVCDLHSNAGNVFNSFKSRQLIWVNQNVLILQISMDDSFRMEILDSFYKLNEDSLDCS